jgi:RNA polymerase sigma-70 factor, ECF subfamily
MAETGSICAWRNCAGSTGASAKRASAPRSLVADSGGRPELSEFYQQVTQQIPFLRRTVRRWHSNKADADDLMQETLVQALAKPHLWQPGSDLRAWLFTIMRNLFLAGIARSNRAAALLESWIGDGAITVADPREARLVLRDVSAALRRLPAKQRAAVLLAGVEGKSYEETAAAMGLTAGAVRCQLARGRDRLRAALHGGDTRSPCVPKVRRLPVPAAIPCAAEHAAPVLVAVSAE